MPLAFSPRTGVCIVHAGIVEETLQPVNALELCNDLNTDIVVAIRAGDPGLEDLVAGMRGRGRVVEVRADDSDTDAHNRALASMVESGRVYGWILGPGMAFAPGALGPIRNHLKRNPECAVVAPCIEPGGPAGDEGSATDVEAVPRVGSLYRIAALRQVGLFAETDLTDGLDAGWCARARAHGWRTMVQPRSVLANRVGARG